MPPLFLPLFFSMVRSGGKSRRSSSGSRAIANDCLGSSVFHKAVSDSGKPLKQPLLRFVGLDDGDRSAVGACVLYALHEHAEMAPEFIKRGKPRLPRRREARVGASSTRAVASRRSPANRVD